MHLPAYYGITVSTSGAVVTGSDTSCSPWNAFIPGSDGSCTGWCPSTNTWWLKLELTLLHYITEIEVTTTLSDQHINTDYFIRYDRFDGAQYWYSINEKVSGVRNSGGWIIIICLID